MDINRYYLLGFLQKLSKHDTRESTLHWVVAEYLVLLALTSCENFGSFRPEERVLEGYRKALYSSAALFRSVPMRPPKQAQSTAMFQLYIYLPLLFRHFKSECNTDIHCISSKGMHVNQGRLPTVTTAKHQKFNVRKPQSCSCYRVELCRGNALLQSIRIQALPNLLCLAIKGRQRVWGVVQDRASCQKWHRLFPCSFLWPWPVARKTRKCSLLGFQQEKEKRFDKHTAQAEGSEKLEVLANKQHSPDLKVFTAEMKLCEIGCFITEKKQTRWKETQVTGN